MTIKHKSFPTSNNTMVLASDIIACTAAAGCAHVGLTCFIRASGPTTMLSAVVCPDAFRRLKEAKIRLARKNKEAQEKEAAA
eukprot:COSAG02_NODE_4822_length_4938_cov_3.900393_3_plen_82_part_00